MPHAHVFLDTNILVYAYDNTAGTKHDQAKLLIKDLWSAPYPPAISTQVLHEFYVNLTCKGIPAANAQEIISMHFAWEIIKSDTALISSSFEVQNRWKISFWNALIVAAAFFAKAKILYSEDLQHGQLFDKLQVLNPFWD